MDNNEFLNSINTTVLGSKQAEKEAEVGAEVDPATSNAVGTEHVGLVETTEQVL